ncbi:MAG TPA: hypothetical protein DCS54_03860 [Oribacterium sp.]|jgi:surface polysaccharide O-acyltransferase-like enzyme|nr:hypothetical protein [Oribacterium sp.]
MNSSAATSIQQKIQGILSDPLGLALKFIYVIGVLVLIYALMNVTHAAVEKDKKPLIPAIKAGLLSLILLLPSPVYEHFFK